MFKEELRRRLLQRRRAIAAEARAQYDAALQAGILAWWSDHPVHSLGVYWPIHGEADLRPAYAELVQRGVQLAMPVVTDAHAPLCFVAWSPDAVMAPGAMNVPEPLPPHRLIVPEALLIPCVGFNRQGFRLGYGGGFYDRTLAASAQRPQTLGIAYACSLADFAADAHDIALDAILTEDGAGIAGLL